MTNTSAPEQEPLPNEIGGKKSDANLSTQQTELPSRYWTFLFDNLKRSIEQIYQTCESDQNAAQCQEVVEFLSRYCQEFEILSKTCQHLENLANRIDKTRSLFRNYLSTSLISLPYQTESSLVRPFEHSQSICNGDLFCSRSLSGRQKRLHNSDINLNVNNNSYSTDTNKFKRQKSNKSRRTTESSSIISLPSLFSSTKSAHDSAMTLVPNTNFKQTLADERAADADDEKDTRDESVHANRHHRYHHHLSSTSLYRLQQQNMTSEDDDDDELLLINHHGMMDFMDRQIFDAFDREESLTAALEAEQERTIASLMAEEEALKHQLNNVTDDGSELEDTELSTRKTMAEKELRDENDSESDSKSRRKHLKIHEKLSSPSRVRPLSETLREAAERQERAFTRRKVLRDERARKMRELTHRVNEVRQWKEELIKARKATIEMKMHRAEEKRLYLLLLRAKKAGDEDLKGQEIAFIRSLQEENRRHTLKERYQKEEQLKQYLEEERVRKHDEHKQRELAAENRRKQLEATRQRRLNEMQEKWKVRERMIEQQLIERRKQKQIAATAKQKSFQQKRAERVADLKTSTAELKKKLAVKQEETTRRHATQLEEVRRKAVEMSVHRGPSAEDHQSSSQIDEKKAIESTDIQRKFCTLCKLLLASDTHLQTHLRSTRHNQLLIERFDQKNDGENKKQPKQNEIDLFNSECITSVTNDDIVRQELSFNRERKHAMKKRAKKLRLRMTQRSTAYEAENTQRPYLTSTHKARIQRFLNELEKSLSTTARKEPLNTTNYLACQRFLSELIKIFDIHGYEKDPQLEQRVFYTLNGYTTLTKMIELRAECNKPPLAPENLIALTVSVYRAATTNNPDNALYILNSGKIITIVDSLDRHLTNFKLDDQTSNVDQSESERSNQIDLIANLSEFLANLLTIYNSKMNEIYKHNEQTNEEKLFISRLSDLISYTANIGILDRIGLFFRTPRALFINSTKPRLPDMIIHLLNVLQQMLQFSRSKITLPPFNSQPKKSTTDTAQVLSIMKFSNFCEVLSLLYGILVHETDINTHPTIITNNNSNLLVNDKLYLIVINSLNLLNTIAILDLETFQTTLGEESISLQLRHVTNYILAYCNHQQNQTSDNLLRQILILLGYYSVLNSDNQCRLACGNRPTVLQQISCLPFRYFVESKHMEIIFPTLISCSFDCETTRAILQTEMSLDLIVNYIQANLNETKTNADDLQSAFSMRFPREQWPNALKYYRSSGINRNQSEEMVIIEKKYTEEEKENVSQ